MDEYCSCESWFWAQQCEYVPAPIEQTASLESAASYMQTWRGLMGAWYGFCTVVHK